MVDSIERSLGMKDDDWQDDKLIRTPEAADLLGVKPATLKIWRYRGTGPPYHRIGSGSTSPVAYLVSDLMAWLEDRRFTSTSAETAERERGAA